jgi:MoxR-like ATPase
MPFELFRGKGPIEPVTPLDDRLPSVDRTALRSPEQYQADEALRHAVDVAIYLGLPLLLTGEPGTGKTQLAGRIAAEFGLGEPLIFETKSSSVAQDVLYTFDAVRRFSLAQIPTRDDEAGRAERERMLDPRRFVRFQALGKAILQANEPDTVHRWLPPGAEPLPARRSVVLIDEIDKAPRDFPNDLLNEIDRRRFRVAEIGDDYLETPDGKAPIVLITSNSEKQLPDAFLRRCVFHHIEPPDDERLATIAAARLPAYRGRPRLLGDAVAFFQSVREDAVGLSKKPSTAELLNWLDVMLGAQIRLDLGLDTPAQRDIALLCLGSLCKTGDDVATAREQLMAWKGRG